MLVEDMNSDRGLSYRIAVLQLTPEDGIAKIICEELGRLGHSPVPFGYGASIPKGTEIVVTHIHGDLHGGPPKLLPVLQQIAQNLPAERPTIVHWNTEGYPDLRIPPPLMWTLGFCRSRSSQLSHSKHSWLRGLASQPPLAWVNNRMHRFRYVGDYQYAYRRGWLNILADSSRIYAQLNANRGMPTVYVPWGATPSVYADLGLERDIDVLWMGKRGTRRRSQLLDQVRQELRSYDVEMHVADNEENPFIFGETRTRFLNRAKICLNLTRTWYDDNFSRFAFAAPNRCLIVSEPLLPHCPDFEAGNHYVSAPIDKLAQSIVYYLSHDDERRAIVDSAYQLVTTTLSFRSSMARLMDAVTQHRTQKDSSLSASLYYAGWSTQRSNLPAASSLDTER